MNINITTQDQKDIEKLKEFLFGSDTVDSLTQLVKGILSLLALVITLFNILVIVSRISYRNVAKVWNTLVITNDKNVIEDSAEIKEPEEDIVKVVEPNSLEPKLEDNLETLENP